MPRQSNTGTPHPFWRGFIILDTKEFKDWLKGSPFDDIKYQINWCKELLKGVRDGLLSPNQDVENYVSTFIHHCKLELKRRKR